MRAVAVRSFEFLTVQNYVNQSAVLFQFKLEYQLLNMEKSNDQWIINK